MIRSANNYVGFELVAAGKAAGRIEDLLFEFTQSAVIAVAGSQANGTQWYSTLEGHQVLACGQNQNKGECLELEAGVPLSGEPPQGPRLSALKGASVRTRDGHAAVLRRFLIDDSALKVKGVAFAFDGPAARVETLVEPRLLSWQGEALTINATRAELSGGPRLFT